MKGRTSAVGMFNAALIFILAAQAKAATLCVNVGGTGNCYSSIQGAVTAAGAGDKITIAAGRYFESVNIPVPGLTLTGPSSAIIDAYDLGDDIDVAATGVTIKGITIANGDDGIDDESAATGMSVSGVTVRSTGDAGIYIDAAGATVKNSLIMGANGDCIDVYAAAATITGNTVRNCDGDNIYAKSVSGVAVSHNNLTNSDGAGVEFDSTTGGTIANNTISVADGYGVDVEGSNPTVTGNLATQIGDSFYVECIDSCSGAEVSHNTITDVVYDDGLEVETEAGGMTIAFNKISVTEASGLYIYGTGSASVENNSVSLAGSYLQSGVYDDGANHTFTANNVSGSQGPGFELYGASNDILTSNTVTANSKAGLELTHSASANSLESNAVNNNLQDGIEIESSVSGTSVTNNKAKGNRVDYCNDGSGTTASGNTFGTQNTSNCIY